MKKDRKVEKFEHMVYKPDAVKKHLMVPQGIRVVFGFADSEQLKSVCFSDTVLKIEKGCFKGCKNLSVVMNYDGIRWAACDVFASTKWLQNNKEEYVIVGDALLRYNGDKKDVYIPEGIRYIGDNAFSYTNIENIYLSDSVYEIGYRAFYECKLLRNVYRSKNSILHFVRNQAFYGCEYLKEVDFLSETIVEYDSLDGTRFSNDAGTFLVIDGVLIRYQGKEKIVVVPDHVKKIGRKAFWYNKEMTEVVLPVALESIGEYAFSDCEMLERVSLPEGLGMIEEGVFYGCSHLESIEIPASVRIIGPHAFEHCGWLNRVFFHGPVSMINKQSFCGCKSLKKIEFPDSPIVFGKGVFHGCTGLEYVTLPEVFLDGGDGRLGVGHLPDMFFLGCESLLDINIEVDLSQIGYLAFSGCKSLNLYKVLKKGIDLSYSEKSRLIDECF